MRYLLISVALLIATHAVSQAQQIIHWTTQATMDAESALSKCVTEHKSDWGKFCGSYGAVLLQACEKEGNTEAACNDVVTRDVVAFASLGSR